MPKGDDFGGLDASDAQAALDQLLAWGPMRRSPQLSAFLSYVVNARIRGGAGSIKAYSIAVDVFGRGADFDPQTDPIVRVQARRLRSLINEFYASGQGSGPIRIVMPVGGYVPEFVPLQAHETMLIPEASIGSAASAEDALSAPEDAEPGSARGNVWIVGLLAACILTATLFFWPTLSERTAGISLERQPVMPVVIVEEFENLAADQQGVPLVAGLALELVTDFEQFADIASRYGGNNADLSPAELADPGHVFILSGVVRRVPEGIRYGAILTRGASEEVVASVDVAVPVAGARPTLRLDDVAQAIALRIGSPRGPLHAATRRWLDSEASADVDLDPYPCLVAFARYFERRAETEAAIAMACATRNADRTGSGEMRAVLAALHADAAWRAGIDTAEGQRLVALAFSEAEAASAAAPTSGFVWTQKAHVAMIAGDLALARDHFNAADQLNPAAVDMVAGYARVLGNLGNWSAALAMANKALEADPEPPGWYYTPLALHALRNGDYEEAARLALLMAPIYPDLASAVMVASGGALRDTEMVNVNLPRLLAAQRYRRLGIMAALRTMIWDTEVLRQLSSGMSMAGVPIDRLARPF